jgi:hypothetical protein
MTTNPEYCCTKRKSGFILLELNVLFMIIVLVSGVYCSAAKMLFKNYRKLLSDIEIAKAARYTESILRRELSYNATQAGLVKDFSGHDQINCKKVFKNVRSYWYISGTLLYRKTVKGTETGINPFSNPEIRIIDFKTMCLEKDKLGIIMTLQDPETGMKRLIPISLFLSNGTVAQ